MKKSLPKIYAAGKIWHAPLFRQLRDAYDFNINSRWIDIEGDSSSPAYYQAKEISRQEIWEQCLADVLACDLMVLWCEEIEEEHRGTIMEAGHAMATGKRIFCINTAKSFTANGISDVAFTQHPLWTFIRESDRIVSPLEGFAVAMGEFMGISETPENVIEGPWGQVRLS